MSNLLHDPGRHAPPPDQVDVLFVLPPLFVFLHRDFPAFPLGLGSMVAHLSKQGFAARIYNADVCGSRDGTGRLRQAFRRFTQAIRGFADVAENWSNYYDRVNDLANPIWSRLRVVLHKSRPTIVGISASVITVPSAMVVARIVREELPEAKVVVGGPAATTCAADVLGCSSIDFLVRGEGEETIAELAAFLLHRDGRAARLGDIRGLVYREGDTTVTAPPRPLISDLDMIPDPDREAMFVLASDGEFRTIHANADILSSRGCPFPCRFCCAFVVWGSRRTRFRTVDSIVNELARLNRTYGQRSFIFWDDLFTANRRRTVELCEKMIASDLRIDWVCLVRLNTIDSELLALMKRAGCREIQIGIESGNDRVLRLIGKDLTVAAIRAKLPIVRAAGIRWGAFFIIGFPSETRAELNDTLQLIGELRPTWVNISIFSPYPGTAFFEELKAQGRLGKGFLRADFWYPHNNYTGTMSDAEFSRVALSALRKGDRYNNCQSLYGFRPLVESLFRRFGFRRSE